MEVYHWWWEVKREGLWGFDTWTMKVCGRSDWVESVRGRKKRRERKNRREEMAIGLCLFVLTES